MVFDDMMHLISDDRFIAIQRRAMDRPLLWDEFVRMEMPDGLGTEQTWELLETLRRQTAVWLPYTDDRDRTGWYAIPRTMMEDLSAIDRYCRPDSWITIALSSRNMVYTLIGQLVCEMVTVLQHDGIVVEYEEARRILFGERKPAMVQEKIVARLSDLIRDTESWEVGSFDETLILHIHDEVSKGFDQPERPTPSPNRTPWTNHSLPPATALHIISDMADGRNVDPAQHPLLVSQGMDSLFRLCMPLESFGATVSWIVRRLYFSKRHLPILGNVPMLSLMDEWEHGTRTPERLGIPFEDAIVALPDSVDFTTCIAGFVENVREELEKVEAELRRTIDEESKYQEMLDRDPAINYRQSSLLLRCLKNPEAVFKIDSHMKAFNITYATARLDLLGLAERGLLDMSTSGRTFVFRPVPGFEKILSRQLAE